MKARFTTISGLEASLTFERKSIAENTSSENTFWFFLKGAASCIQWILPNRKRKVEQRTVYQIPYQSKLSQKGQKAFWVNSVGIDQHYHLPGASPPPANFTASVLRNLLQNLHPFNQLFHRL